VSRYYLVEDEKIISMIKDIIEQKTKAWKKAEEWAKSNNVGEPVFMRWNIFDSRLHGFRTYGNNYKSELLDWDYWTKPKKRMIWPKAKKGSKLLSEFRRLQKECEVYDKAVHELLGWNVIDHFPTSPGFNYDGENNMAFVTANSWESMKGCKEITNIEFIEIFESEES